MEILTWNIQAGRGVDNVNDIQRIASVIQGMGDPDVICLQEVACNFPVLDDGRGEDQVHSLSDLFPNHDAIYGAAIDCIDPNNNRVRFGNLLLSRLPVVQKSLHQLPRPVDPEHKNMPRQLTEVIVRDANSWIRIMTTHLEYHSVLQRQAQVHHIRGLLNEAHKRAKAPIKSDTGPYEVLKETEFSVLCGDFNFEPADPLYSTLAAADIEAEALFDAWCVVHGGIEHAATCGIFDKEQWPEGAHCRDYCFVSSDLVPRIKLLEVNSLTDASDHQPVRLVLR